MNGLRDTSGRPTGALSSEAGFTLIEVLMALLVGIIVIGAGTFGLASAFQQNTEVVARTSSAYQGEVGLQRLTGDLRYATACPTFAGTNTLGSGQNPVLGLLVSTGPMLQMCDTVAGSHASEPPALALVTWTCTTAAATESCARATAAVLCPVGSGTVPATGPCTGGSPSLDTSSGSFVIHGVQALAVSGIVAGANQPSLISDSTCQVAAGVYGYSLTAGSTCPLSWVGIQARLATLADPGAPTSGANNVVTSSKDAPISVQTGVDLRNYGA